MSHLDYTVSANIATITLDRPEKRNAFTFEMLDAWVDALRAAQADGGVHVLVITGSGGAFCSGVDLDEFAAARRSTLQDKLVLTERVHRVAFAMQDLDKPVLAAIDGVAIGAGMDMALMCDLRLASRAARFAQGYVRVGLVPGDGGCWLLPRLVGMPKALELMWTGDIVDAEEALRIGLVNHLYDDAASLERGVRDLSRRLAAGPQIVLRMIKRAAYQSAATDLRTALDLISSHQAVVQSTADSSEALAAFRENRPAIFEGE